MLPSSMTQAKTQSAIPAAILAESAVGTQKTLSVKAHPPQAATSSNTSHPLPAPRHAEKPRPANPDLEAATARWHHARGSTTLASVNDAVPQQTEEGSQRLCQTRPEPPRPRLPRRARQPSPAAS